MVGQVDPSIAEYARAITYEMEPINSKAFSFSVFVALVAIIIEAIKLYRDCKKTPEEFEEDMKKGLSWWRPLQLIRARRLIKKHGLDYTEVIPAVANVANRFGTKSIYHD